MVVDKALDVVLWVDVAGGDLGRANQSAVGLVEVALEVQELDEGHLSSP